MYNKESIIFDINMITKLLCYILFTSLIVINNNITFFILIEIIILIESRNEEIFFKYNILSICVFLFGILKPEILFVPKIFLLISYTYLLTKVVNIGQLRYLIEISFYKYKNNKLTKLFLMIMYYFKYIKVYINKYIDLRKSYGFQSSYWYTLFTIKQANRLTRTKIKELVKINEIRFYNYYNKKTYLEKIRFESWDYIYLSIHIILLVISILVRR